MDTRNGIPKKITPDCLVDSIVEFVIKTDYKDEFIEHIVCDSIKDAYPDDEFRTYPMTGKDEGKHFLANDKFRVYVCSNLISINIVSQYPGWNVLNRFIKDALQGLYNQEKPVVDFMQVRIKYVSKFPNISIFEVWDGDPIKLNQIPPFLGREFSFKFSILSREKQLLAEADVKLNDQLPLVDGKGVYSRIYVALQAVKGDGNWSIVYEQLQMLHENEKVVFFRLLSKEFVGKLNPEW